MTTWNWGCSPDLGLLFGSGSTLEQLDRLHGQKLYERCEAILDGASDVPAKYKQWIEQQRYHVLYILPFSFGYVELIGWFVLFSYYSIWFANSAMGFFVMLILIITQTLHCIGISVSWKRTKVQTKILKRFNEYLIELSKTNENLTDTDTLDYIKHNLHEKKNWEATISFQRWNNLFRIHDHVEFLEDWHTFAFCLIKYVFSLTMILTLFAIEVATFCIQVLDCSVAAYDTAVVIYYIMLVVTWFEINGLYYLVMVCNNGIDPRLARKLVMFVFIFVLIFYAIIIIILYASDPETTEAAASGESNVLSDYVLPSIFGVAGLVILIWSYLRWKGYGTWTRMIFFWLCMMEVFWAGSWRILFLGLFSLFLLALCAYMDFQHRCHHAVTKLKQKQYKDEVCMQEYWIKESILTALIGQFSLPYVQVFRTDPIEQGDDEPVDQVNDVEQQQQDSVR